MHKEKYNIWWKQDGQENLIWWKIDLMHEIWFKIDIVRKCVKFLVTVYIFFIEGILFTIFPKLTCDCNKICYRTRKTNRNIAINILNFERKML